MELKLWLRLQEIFFMWNYKIFFFFFFLIYVMQVYNLLRKEAMSKCVRSGTCGEKASIDGTPSRPVSG